jgi:hypothetical protein
MWRENHRAPYVKVPIPYIPEDEKEADLSDGNPPSVKLLIDAAGKAFGNPTVQAQHIFNGGTMEQFFKLFQCLRSLLEGKSVGEYFCLVLQALRGNDKVLWQREMDLTSPKIAESAGIPDEAAKTMVRQYYEADHELDSNKYVT